MLGQAKVFTCHAVAAPVRHRRWAPTRGHSTRSFVPFSFTCIWALFL